MASIIRKTNETNISVELNLTGGEINVDTGIGFFDHMLASFAKHAGFGLKLRAAGDLNVDSHHTVEDVGIVLGLALNEALGDKSGIARYGTAFIPMDEALAFASVDISGRPYIVFDADFKQEKTGGFDTCTVEEFMRAFATNAKLTLHIKALYGTNAHHMIEAMFKALAHALKVAVKAEGQGILSTKGIL
ncbi:MAG TPA: imidazoleglycerol-phosphate dehydratase HisB [Clostridiales bacterium]|nr:imidazoleglycerol-phosphate dehydratase HisB [Clostridiales bacterium]